MTHVPHFLFILCWTVKKQLFVDKTALSVNKFKKRGSTSGRNGQFGEGADSGHSTRAFCRL